MWSFACFAIICTILKTWKIPMEEWYPSSMGVFHIFKIVLFVPNNAKRLIYMSNYSSSFMGLRRGLQRCIKAVGVCKRKYGRPFSIVIKREGIFTLSTHCWPMFPFYAPCKLQKTKVFQVFSGGIIWEHCQKWVRKW